MAKYTPSYLDISGFNKALSDQLYRNAQINLRREQMLDADIDQNLRMYTGGIRIQDKNLFTEKFNQFANVSKGYMKVNRSGAPGQTITDMSLARQIAKKEMIELSDESREVASIEKMLAEQKNNVRDTSLYTEVRSDLSTKNIYELKQKWGGIDKIPTRFEWKKEKFDESKLNASIKARQTQMPKSPIQWSPVLNPDGSQKTEIETFEIADDKGNKKQVTLNVPLKQYNVSVDPISTRYNMEIVSYGDNTGANKDYFNDYKDRVLNSLSNQQDPVISKFNRELVEFAMSKYGKSKIEDLNGEDLYSAYLVKNSDLGTIIQKDYDKLDDMYKMWARQNNVSVSEERLKALKEQRSRASYNDKIRAVNSVMNTFRTATNTGLWGLDGTGDMLIDLINDIFPGFVDKKTLSDAIKNKTIIAEQQMQQRVGQDFPR